MTDERQSNAAALARINELEALVSVLVRELRYIEGISNGQVQRVAKQALAKLPDNAEVSGAVGIQSTES